jgi:hypothetical protein
MKCNLFIWILTIALAWSCQKETTNRLTLAGQWNFSLDSTDVGIREEWFNKKLEQNILLPGSLAENGYGDEPNMNTPWVGNIIDSTWFKSERFAKYRTPGNFKPPMWLTPTKYYRGVAWYQKEVNIPSSWENRTVELFLERCHWETQVWVDNKKVGSKSSLGTPHVHDLSEAIQPGKHTITIRVNNDLIVDVGVNSHSVSDHTQTNWNGIVGTIELRSHPGVRLEGPKIVPDVETGDAHIQLSIRNKTGTPFKGKLILSATSTAGVSLPEASIEVNSDHDTVSVLTRYNLKEGLQLWSEFNPVVYRLKAKLVDANNQLVDSLSESFGMRELKARGRAFELNGTPVFLRGTLECAIFPLTGYPPTDGIYWSKIFTTARAHGLNHLRFHSWCPPEAAFKVADEMGFYLQIECSSWANQSTTIGDGKPVDGFVMQESEDIVNTYGNHPSFCLMAYGNEPGGANQNSYLTKFERHWKAKDNRRLYTSGSGWPVLDENEYHSTPTPRIQAWGEQLKSIINAQPPRTDYDWADRISKLDKPVVSHEIGQWCAYPNFEEIKKYTGVLRAKNFELFKETLEENNLGHLSHDFLMASGKLQTLCYKADIEAALRTPGFGGFQLLDLHDFPGQGTALVGVLDAFWDSKGYVTAAEYKRFCAETVPLARIPKLVLKNNEIFKADVEFAHYGPRPIADATVYWRLENANDKKIVAGGKWNNVSLRIGSNQKAGSVSLSLNDLTVPAKFKFIVGLEGTPYENDWDIWIYPSKLTVIKENNIVQTSHWKEAKAALDKGKKVLFIIGKGNLKQEAGGDIGVGFSSIFWNTSWTRNQAPHTLGILCDPGHPALKDFPTEFHSNWQWWQLVTGAQAMVLDSLPLSLDPAIKMIDTWFKNRKLALLFEAKMGKGKLMVCSMDLHNLKDRPVAAQLRHSILGFMDSEKFNPPVEVKESDLLKLITE